MRDKGYLTVLFGLENELTRKIELGFRTEPWYTIRQAVTNYPIEDRLNFIYRSALKEIRTEWPD